MTEAHHVFVDGSCREHRFLAVAFFDATTGEAKAKRLKKWGNFHRSEIEAIRYPLEYYKNNGVRILAIYSDNPLIVKILNDKAHCPRYLKKTYKRIRALQRKYEKVVFVKIPREQNVEANDRAQSINGVPIH